jgi:hypothetical protein
MQLPRATWLFSVLTLVSAAHVHAQRADEVAAKSAVDVTILRTINLPWQEPEAIISAPFGVDSAHVEVRIDGAAGPTRALAKLDAGASRSVTWPAKAGSHECEVRVVGTREGLPFDTLVRARVDVVAPLEVKLAPKDVDLRKRQLRFFTSSGVSFAELSLYDLDGKAVHKATTRFEPRAHKQGYALTWPELAQLPARIGLRVFATDDTWTDVEWSPLEIEVPHEPIYFEDTFADAGTLEKLSGAYAVLQLTLSEHTELHGLRVYVLGTGVDGAESDEAMQRALAVAAYFRERGLALPIYVGGFVDADAASAHGEVQAILALSAPSVTSWTALSRAGTLKRAR